MSDTPPERNSNSKSNLIEVQHVGVTAKLQSPLKNILQTSSSSTETENGQVLFRTHSHKTKYNKFSNDTQAESTESTAQDSKVLYEMRAMRSTTKNVNKGTPSKIEFQLYKRSSKRSRHAKSSTKKKKKPKRRLFDFEMNAQCNDTVTETSIFQRLRNSLEHQSRHSTELHPHRKAAAA